MTVVTELELPEFDYSAPDLTGEVYHQRLAETAKHGWLARGPFTYVVLDRGGAEFFLRSRETAFPGREIADLFGVTSGRMRDHIDANILNQSGDHHRRLRALVGPAFTPRAADRWRPDMRRFLERLWRPAASSCDFVAEIARPYPALVITTVMGAPERDAGRLHEWSNWVQRQFDVRALSTELPRIEQAAGEVYDYVQALLERRRTDPGDDLISTLLAAEDGGDRLSHDECVNLLLNMMSGGIDTTQAQLSHALRLFAEHPDQWALLGAEPERAGRAVEEVLRFEPITPFTARICLSDLVYRGIVFPAGTLVGICAERANRDVGEEFDITAERDRRSLTFGAGAHYCLGANLAKAELEEALAFLAPRMRGLEPAAPPAFGGVEGIYGMEALPLRWTP
ncbi:cytochrome P450 [Actinomadura roseirufa]|uniref:cytochrome P450 n=1 Tax=Actinomadura roseirufa TaxID=2094049 RepID=UPI001041118D|nr:cytochrome P450 [Actinomadura roseirufa]